MTPTEKKDGFAKPWTSSRGVPGIQVAGYWLDAGMDRTADRDTVLNAINSAFESAVKERVEEAVKQERHEFKNFHRSLCERFHYQHDEKDWKRDQVSLEEHIAKGKIREAEDRVWEEAAKIADKCSSTEKDDHAWCEEGCCGKYIASALRARRSKDKGK